MIVKSLFSYLYIAFLYILPKNIISRIFGIFARWRPPYFIRILVLNIFSKIYGIDLAEAELDLREYSSLNEFFTRALKKKVRPIDRGKKTIVSPVDGKILNFGVVERGNILQVKKDKIPIKDILVEDDNYKKFLGGLWLNLYLAPKDYHRIHSPVSGNIIGYSYKTGRLMPVNQIAINILRSLFSRNERLTSYIKTSFGLTALTKIGAMNVGSIRVTYDNNVSTNTRTRSSKRHSYKKGIPISKGAELGRFEMGSTVILFVEKGKAKWTRLKKQKSIRYGEIVGSFL